MLPGQGALLAEHPETDPPLAAVFVALGTSVDPVVVTILHIGDARTGGVEPGIAVVALRTLELVVLCRLVARGTRKAR